MPDIQQIHEDIYDLLIKKHEENSEFRFTTRITNRFKRLDEGYWFHGNDSYLTLSFWSGMDWKNKTPNIQFVVTREECFLGISVSDSEEKRRFVKDYIKPALQIEGDVRYYHWLGDSDWEGKGYENILEEFLKAGGRKEKIDKIISENSLLSEAVGITLIDKDSFTAWIDNIEWYRANLTKLTTTAYKLFTLRKIEINRFPGSDQCIIDNIPQKNRCIFLTGENGTGKTSILRAIGAALQCDHNNAWNSRRRGDYNYDVKLELTSGEQQLNLDFNSLHIDNVYKIDQGYASYGPNRLMTNELKKSNKDIEERMQSNYSLFNLDPILIDIEKGLEEWTQDKVLFDQRLTSIKSVMSDTIPGFIDFNFQILLQEKSVTLYTIQHSRESIVKDESEKNISEDRKNEVVSGSLEDTFKEVTFEELATGARSIIAMLGDMMVRLFKQQPLARDVAALTGIVLIDEIDIHLHPTFQKALVRRLTTTFPNIQFIITTHSPVPLLGAPENSVFYVVQRDDEGGLEVQQIDDLIVKNLTPDTILTSPIFGMQDILHTDYQYSHDYFDKSTIFDNLRTESTYDASTIVDAELESLLRKYQQRKGGGHDQLK